MRSFGSVTIINDLKYDLNLYWYADSRIESISFFFETIHQGASYELHAPFDRWALKNSDSTFNVEVCKYRKKIFYKFEQIHKKYFSLLKEQACFQ